MILPKSQALKPIIESSEGLHLSAYIENSGDISELQRNIQDVLEEAEELLRPVLKADDRADFLDPLYDLRNDRRLLERLQGHLGLFRKRDSFRIIKIPIEIKNTCVVANSFHIKPLLRWMQVDREFLLVVRDGPTVDLYTGNLSSFKHEDTLILPGLTALPTNWPGLDRAAIGTLRNVQVSETLDWLRGKIGRLQKTARPRLFFAGDEAFCSSLLSKIHYSNKAKDILPIPPGMEAHDLCKDVRKALQAEAKAMIQFALSEYHFAEAENRTRKNLFQIVRAALKGKIKKLIVADGILIFGKINRKTGGVAIHPTELDHEDDDILDDLAQTVLSQGGEVVVASREEIPKGYPALAILKRTPRDQRKFSENLQTFAPKSIVSARSVLRAQEV